jgi:hypothetical protein
METEIIARIDENVKYLRESFDEHKESFNQHVQHDNQIANDYIKPLWEERNQRIGAANYRKAGSVVLGWAINAGIAVAAAWAAVRGMKP